MSGDGGYNEVVDGVMHADNPGAVCAVLGAGNANDHRRATRKRPLADAVVAGEISRIDLLALTVGSGSDVADAVRALLHRAGAHADRRGRPGEGRQGVVQGDPVRGAGPSPGSGPHQIELEDGTRRTFDSLLFANITEMAKYATLSENGRPDDGRFEVVTVPHSAKWRILAVAIKAAVRGLGPQPTATHYGFVTLKPTPLQLDGELLTLDAGTPVQVDIVPKALPTIS